jgi:UDP-GlcNAc:undecaprenyl-phosphate GlcNAc-1-phosphate transferase
MTRATLAVFTAALVLSLLLTPVAMRIAQALGIIDRPDRRLKKHTRPVPYLGGLAIFISCVTAVIAAKYVVDGTPRGVIGMLAGATMVFGLGLWDDVRPLGPGIKLMFQALAALVPISLGVHIKFIENPWGAIPLTLLWLVGVTNAFNLLDIMDGLCASIALVAALWFWLISGVNGRFNDALTSAALAGSVMGFLWYNRPPARVFMGDAGSLFIGFLMASLAIGQGYSMKSEIGVIAPVLILGFPVFETLFVMTVRCQQGKHPLRGSPDHIPLRLLRMGFTREKVLLVIGLVCAGLGAVAYAMIHMNWERAIVTGMVLAAAAMMAAVRLASVDMNPVGRPGRL